VKLYIVLTKLNPIKVKPNCTTDRKLLNRLYHVNETCLIILHKRLYRVKILFKLTYIHSDTDTVASPNKHALQSICFLYLIDLSGYKLIISFNKLL